MVHARLLLLSDAREDRVTLGPDSVEEGSVRAIRAAEDIELHRAHAVVGAVVGFQPCGELKGCLGAVENGLIGRADIVEEFDGGRETRVNAGSLGVDGQKREGWTLRIALTYEGQVHVEVVCVQ